VARSHADAPGAVRSARLRSGGSELAPALAGCRMPGADHPIPAGGGVLMTAMNPASAGGAPATPSYSPGLAGVVAGESAISAVDGVSGLLYRGYDIHELAVRASFEEVIYLLL